MSLLASALLLGADGAAYMLLGACMLLPPLGAPPWSQQLARLYPSVFKGLLPQDDEEEARPGGGELACRMLAYLLLILGLCRLITCFHWGCGYIYLGLATCLAEIAMLCHELLRHEALLLHRAMAVVLQNMAVSLIYIGAGVPYCR
jgi:membrane associated rhomboid family serine protease